MEINSFKIGIFILMKLNFMMKNVFNFFLKKIIDLVDNFLLILVGVKWEIIIYINFFFGGGGGCKSLYRYV